MKNKTIVFGLIAVLIIGFFTVYLIRRVGISFSELIMACETEKTALTELRQDNLQKDMVIQTFLKKIKDKDITIKVLMKVIEDEANCQITEGNFKKVQENGFGLIDRGSETCITLYTTEDIPYGIWEGGWIDSPKCPSGYMATGCEGGCNGIDIDSISFDIYSDYCRLYYTCKGGGLLDDIDATVRCCKIK